MPRSEEEVFAHFRNDTTLTREQAHLAYAAFAEAKHDWYQHVFERSGSPPNAAEVEAWIAALPDSRLDELRLTSFAFFEDAAEAYMQEQIEAAKSEAVAHLILGEIQRLNQDLKASIEKATSSATAWRIGIGAGVTGSVLFTLLVALGNWIFASDPSPFALIKTLEGRHHEPSNALAPPMKSPLNPNVTTP